MADETDTPRKSNTVLIIVIIAVAIFLVLPVCALCGITVLGSSLQSSFSDVANEVEAAQPAP